jgi:YD repeat-containing protein
MKMIPRRTVCLALAVLLAAPALAAATVTLKNGNYYVSYVDAAFPGGFEPKIERVYNSKTPFKGVFGWGWGWDLEVYLSAEADGSVTVHEYGGGAEVSFTVPAEGTLELETAIEDLSRATARKRGLAGAALEAYRTRLREDAMFRRDEWAARVREGELRSRDVPVGVRLSSRRFSYQWLLRMPGGWLRALDDGRRQRFDARGRLERVSDANGNFIELSYGANEKPEALVDNFGRSIRLEYGARKLVSRAVADDGRGHVREASYLYNASDELVTSVDTDGNRHRYEYDDRHNLRRIGYADGTDLSVAYFTRSRHENVRLVKDTDGSVTRYAYDTDPRDPGHRTIAVDEYGREGDVLSQATWEYFNRRRANGAEWLWRMVQTRDERRHETTYHERCGEPVEIVRDGERGTFEYDEQCRLTRKETPTEVTELAYAAVGKVSRVVRRSADEPGIVRQVDFEYDDRGNLLRASNSDGQRVALTYDATGRIATVRLDEKVAGFEYDHNSKPVRITLTGGKEIRVRYSPGGEIEKVESPGGPASSLEVISVIQTLTEIVRPAGVSLFL